MKVSTFAPCVNVISSLAPPYRLTLSSGLRIFISWILFYVRFVNFLMHQSTTQNQDNQTHSGTAQLLAPFADHSVPFLECSTQLDKRIIQQTVDGTLATLPHLRAHRVHALYRGFWSTSGAISGPKRCHFFFGCWCTGEPWLPISRQPTGCSHCGSPKESQ